MSLDDKQPFLSVVIPTHNRSEMISKVIEAVFQQDYPKDRMEVFVALDDCSDDTELRLQSLNPPCQFRYMNLPKVGQAVARNKGIELSIGEVVVLLDDDVEPTPGFLRAHAKVHGESDNLVVQGYYPFWPGYKRSLHMVTVARWWEEHFARLAQPGRIIGPHDLCAGNLSVRRDHLLAVGGFDESFTGYGNEDYELGLRLGKHGLEFRFCRDALAWHYYDTPLINSLKRTQQEAPADVIYGRKYPLLKRNLRLFTLTQDGTFLGRLARIMAFRFPRGGDWGASFAIRVMGTYERLGLRGMWTRTNWALRRYYYWCGVRDSLGSLGGLKEYLGDDWIDNPAQRRAKVLSIDLTKELKAIEGLNGYRSAYILLKDGVNPLSWVEIETDGDWLSADDLKQAIEQEAARDETSNSRETVGVASTVLPSRLQNASWKRRPSEASRRKWKVTTRSADYQ